MPGFTGAQSTGPVPSAASLANASRTGMGPGIAQAGAAIADRLKEYRERVKRDNEAIKQAESIGKMLQSMNPERKDQIEAQLEQFKDPDMPLKQRAPAARAFVTQYQQIMESGQRAQEAKRAQELQKRRLELEERGLKSLEEYRKAQIGQMQAPQIPKPLTGIAKARSDRERNLITDEEFEAIKKQELSKGGGTYMGQDDEGRPIFATGEAASALATTVGRKSEQEKRITDANKLFSMHAPTLRNYRDQAIGPEATARLSIKEPAAALGLVNITEQDLQDQEFRTQMSTMYQAMIGMGKQLADDDKLSDQDVKRYEKLPKNPEGFFREPKLVKERMKTLMEVVARGTAADIKARYNLDVVNSTEDLKAAAKSGAVSGELLRYYAYKYHAEAMGINNGD